MVWWISSGHYPKSSFGRNSIDWVQSYLYKKGQPLHFAAFLLISFFMMIIIKKKFGKNLAFLVARWLTGATFRGAETLYLGLSLSSIDRNEFLSFFFAWWIVLVCRFFAEDVLYAQPGKNHEDYHPFWN